VVFEVTDMKIKNAVVLVTGSNRGLGLALVRAALAAGARKVYAGARDGGVALLTTSSENRAASSSG
jgi:NAD(P)-dependent dehydrogenase (short-subunit alcohol dehydrogenase family)